MKSFTKEELSLLEDVSISHIRLGETFNCHSSSIARWRKELGIKVPRGLRKGTVQPHKFSPKVEVACKHCGSKHTVTESMSKRWVYCSRECMYASDEYIDKLRNMDKSYMQTEAYSAATRKPDTDEYVRYKNLVHRLSQKTYGKYVDLINPNGYNRTVAGIEGGYQLDHIIEVRFGFDNGIPAEVLAEKENLRMLPWKENLARNKKDLMI